jgi:hypothetical protein
VTDSNQLRQQRKRAHAKGDHGLCVPSRCGAKLSTLRVLPQAGDETFYAGPEAHERRPAYGPATEAAITSMAALPFTEEDPRYLVMVTTVEMARAFDQTQSPALAAAITAQVKYLVDHFDATANRTDEIRAAVARKQADILIRHAFGASSAS